MPPAVSARPQTSRQARRAYLKAGPTARLSEHELRQLERSAELQERADRIKERENKRKANLNKKNERIEKERDARQRMGIASPVKETVGASQMRLGAFMGIGMGLKRKREDTPVLTPSSSSENSNGSGIQGTRIKKQERPPLQPRSGNQVYRLPSEPPQKTTESPKNVPPDSFNQKREATVRQDTEGPMSNPSSRSPIEPRPKPSASTPSRSPPTTPAIRPPPSAKPPYQSPSRTAAEAPSRSAISKPPENSIASPPTAISSPTKSTAPTNTRPPNPPSIGPRFLKSSPRACKMPPPTARPMPPPISRPMPPPNTRLKPPPTTKRMPPPPRPFPPIKHPIPKTRQPLSPLPPEDPWAAFLVSNTQIERELSVDEKPPVVLAPQPIPRPASYQKHGFISAKASSKSSSLATLEPQQREDTAALLAGLCTQDLAYDAYDSPDEDEPHPLPAAVGKAMVQSFGDDAISDSDFEDVARDVEERSSGRSASHVSDEELKARESFCDDLFDISTQELCELDA